MTGTCVCVGTCGKLFSIKCRVAFNEVDKDPEKKKFFCVVSGDNTRIVSRLRDLPSRAFPSRGVAIRHGRLLAKPTEMRDEVMHSLVVRSLSAINRQSSRYTSACDPLFEYADTSLFFFLRLLLIIAERRKIKVFIYCEFI